MSRVKTSLAKISKKLSQCNSNFMMVITSTYNYLGFGLDAERI